MVTAPTAGDLCLSPELFGELFPFHLGFNQAGIITRTGPSLRRVSATVAPGLPLTEILQPYRPEEAFDFKRITEASPQLYRVRMLESGITLRGEMRRIGEELIFLGTPWLHDPAELTRHGLKLCDFALHDSTLDLLQMLQLLRIDASDLRELTQRLETKERFLKAIVDALPLSLVIEDEHNGLLMLKALDSSVGGAQRTIGLHDAGQAEADTTWVPRDAEIERRVRETGQIGEFEVEREISGLKRWFRCIKFPVTMSSSSTGSMGSLFIEITAQKRIDAEIFATSESRRELLEIQREFIAMVSHEFRTPLTAIEGSCYLLRKLLVEPEILPGTAGEKTAKWLGLQSTAIGTLKELVDQVLLLNRIEHGARSEAPLSKASPGPLLDEIVAHFNGIMLENRVTLQNDFPAGLEMAFDRGLVRVAVENLVSNGLKYSWHERQVQVRVWAGPEEWMIEVADHGRGIPESDQDRLGQTFFRASNVGTVPGTGLGLAIVKRIVSFHGGHAEFHSKQNVGTRVTLYFPYMPSRNSTCMASRVPFPNHKSFHE